MKNITINIREETAEWVRVHAARHGTSVSRYVGELLDRQMQQEVGYESAMQAFFSAKPKPLKKSGSYPGRVNCFGGEEGTL